MVDEGAVGAAQGHPNGLRSSGRAAGALVLHAPRVDGVQGFAGTFTLCRGRERQGFVMLESPAGCFVKVDLRKV